MPILDLNSGWICNAVEKNLKPLSVPGPSFRFAVKPFEIATIRVQGTTALNLPE
jgi:hypothetical protein